jgi:hypothetical protein
VNLQKTRGVHKLGLLLLACLALAACSVSFTTAHISDLKIFKDKAKQHAVDSFTPQDTIYAQAIVANAAEKVTLKWQLVTEDVQGTKKNATVPSLDTSIDLAGDGQGNYTLTPPDNGWPLGKYRIEVGMFIEGGDRKDFKTIAFEVAEN